MDGERHCACRCELCDQALRPGEAGWSGRIKEGCQCVAIHEVTKMSVNILFPSSGQWVRACIGPFLAGYVRKFVR